MEQSQVGPRLLSRAKGPAYGPVDVSAEEPWADTRKR